MYSQLSPFATTSLSYSESDSNAVADSVTSSITKTIGTSLSNTISNSTSDTIGKNSSRTSTISITPIGIGGSFAKTTGTSRNFTRQTGISKGESWSDSTADMESAGKTDTYTNTSGRTLQINFENKKVKDVLKKLEQQIERIDDALDLGLWNAATYCVADDSQTSKILASAIESLYRGEKSSTENFTVATWDDRIKLAKVHEYLNKFMHPVLEMPMEHGCMEINPTSLMTGKELVIEAGIPQRSIGGLPVSEMVSFARNVVDEIEEDGEKIRLGSVYHMGKEEDSAVDLKIQSLSAHTLVTGSTGSGKSNTVYKMLDELNKRKITFLVIEPAKGEYKHIFGKIAHVYGTNEKYMDLLKINPFAFPEYIHVLEHVDRLIEIFNVCWPMYAAMPAVLKEAVLQSYEKCGWDLEVSENMYGMVFPNFLDLLTELVAVIDTSAYSEEVKSNYMGSLATRVKSLSNGINGKIFCDQEVDLRELFDKNTIVDLSRVGSLETKSLIMGILVMKLGEYRMAQSNGIMNQKIKHVTVLEEAHNILKNSAGNVGNAEGGGTIEGKSVEMLSNSIAEIRTYGEGFIIVDQSPGAIDISAIRNTNTKIIMRLPEESDRRQAGGASALNEKQVAELAKLPRGVAVVYQNNWLDPVLCIICKAEVKEQGFSYQPSEVRTENENKAKITTLLAVLMNNRIDEKVDDNIDGLSCYVDEMKLSMGNKILLKKALEELSNKQVPQICQEESFELLSALVSDILNAKEYGLRFVEYRENCDLQQQELDRVINRHTENMSSELRLAVSQCLFRDMLSRNQADVEMYSRWREYAVEQRKLR